MLISLVILPGAGVSDITLSVGTTVAQLVAQEGLSGRQICVDGEIIEPSDFDTFVLVSGVEVAALTPAKGN